MKLILGNPPSGNKNVIEVVHVAPTLNLNTRLAGIPSHSWRLTDGAARGIPACGLDSVTFGTPFATLHGSPVTRLQVLLAMNDTGDEHGALERDNDLVRLKRRAVCCISGVSMVLLSYR